MIQDMWKVIENKGKKHYQVGENLQEIKTFKHNKNNLTQYVRNSIFFKVSHWRDLNPRPADYESAALPTELQWHSKDQVY